MLALLSRAGMIGLGIWHGDPGNDAEVMFAEGKALANRLGNVRAQALLEAGYSGALGSRATSKRRSSTASKARGSPSSPATRA